MKISDGETAQHSAVYNIFIFMKSWDGVGWCGEGRQGRAGQNIAGQGKGADDRTATGKAIAGSEARRKTKQQDRIRGQGSAEEDGGQSRLRNK